MTMEIEYMNEGTYFIDIVIVFEENPFAHDYEQTLKMFCMVLLEKSNACL